MAVDSWRTAVIQLKWNKAQTPKRDANIKFGMWIQFIPRPVSVSRVIFSSTSNQIQFTAIRGQEVSNVNLIYGPT